MQPSQLLPHNVVQVLRNNSRQAESQGYLTSEQLQVIKQHNWFNLFVPISTGGLELSLPDAVQLEEGIAWADGSVGWVVTLCAGAGMFIGYFNQTLRNEIFNTPFVCLAGSGQTAGKAVKNGDGYIVSGIWPYASGAPHATHLTANCIIEPGGEVKSFVFLKEEVELQPNWQYMGLNATAGYAYQVKALHVPAYRTFTIDPAHVTLPHPVYRYPFLQLAETTIAANIAGMCQHFFDLAGEAFNQNHTTNQRSTDVRIVGQEKLKIAQQTLYQLRQTFYAALHLSWKYHLDTNETPAYVLQSVSTASVDMATKARQLVNDLYQYCGMYAARTDTPINQVWRNINTASQHTLLISKS